MGKKRILKTVKRGDLEWLQYESGGEPAELRVDHIVEITPTGGRAHLICCQDAVCGGSGPMCDSTSAEVLEALGWDR